MTDIIDQLMDAAERVEELDRSDLQVLLRRAAIDIGTLRELVGLRDEVLLEDVEPEGHG